MQNYLKNKIILVKYPFTDHASAKIRPAVVISNGVYDDLFIVPLTSRTNYLQDGEFILKDWKKSGLNIETAIKCGIYTVQQTLILKEIGYLSSEDSEKLYSVLSLWLNLL